MDDDYRALLDDVARDARALADGVRAANALPQDFPRESVLLLCEALEGLPNGTAEGSRAILLGADERIGAWRYTFFRRRRTNNAPADPDAPTFERGDLLDRASETLLTSIRDAIEARLQDSERRPDVRGTVVAVPDTVDFGQAATVEELTKVEDGTAAILKSPEIQNLPRPADGQGLRDLVTDASNQAKAGKSELKLRDIRPWILDRLATASPQTWAKVEKLSKRGIAGGGSALFASVIGLEPLSAAISASILAASIGMKHVAMAVRWHQQARTSDLPTKTDPDALAADPTRPEPPPFDLDEAKAMILRGEELPKAWVPQIYFLLFEGNEELSDLSPLSVLTELRVLSLKGTQVIDLSPLSSLTNLIHLDLADTNVSDLSPLNELTSLSFLHLRNTKVTDLSPLRGLTALTWLDLQNTKVSELSPLSGLTSLTSLSLWGTQVSGVSALSPLTALTSLNLWGTQVQDISELRALTALTELSLVNTPVSDVSALSAMTDLSTLYLGNTQVSDISALSSLTALTELDLSQTPVSDVSALSTLTALTSLKLWDTQISDVSSFSALTALTSLDISYTKVSDVSPLDYLVANGLKIEWDGLQTTRTGRTVDH